LLAGLANGGLGEVRAVVGDQDIRFAVHGHEKCNLVGRACRGRIVLVTPKTFR
jgi:hypothetical protein